MTIQFRPLGRVKQMVESVGLDISYAYDDLVFSGYSMFIIRFCADDDGALFLYFNVDCDESEAASVEDKLHLASAGAGFSIKRLGYFRVGQVDGQESISIEFTDTKPVDAGACS